MHIVSIVVQSWLLLWMFYQAVSKLSGQKIQVELFESIRLPQWFRVVTGVVQLVGCAALIAGYWIPGFAAWAGLFFGLMMIVAGLSHIRVKEPFAKLAPALVTFVIAAAVFLLFIDEMGSI